MSKSIIQTIRAISITIHLKNILNIIVIISAFVLLTGCSLFRGRARTPLPTFTPTSAILGISAPANAGAVGQPDSDSSVTSQTDALIVITKAPPPTSTPMPTATLLPTDTMPPPTLIPTITNTSVPVLAVTPTPTLIPTPTPEYLFYLEDYAKFPTDSLAPDVIRIYLYVYSKTEFLLSGYSLQVHHNGIPLSVDGESTDGLPTKTHEETSPYSRFTNFNVVFVESQAGEWTVELRDSRGAVVGPPAQFTLTTNEETRELYVRYLRKENLPDQ